MAEVERPQKKMGAGRGIARHVRPVIRSLNSASMRSNARATRRSSRRLGGRDNDAPGLRADHGTKYYAAFVVDPGGYRIEAHCGGS